MSNAKRVLHPNVREPLEKHLDAVEQALTDAGVSRSERRSICDEVEAQACEMVWKRAEGEPAKEDMRAVLLELDDPEAYLEAAEESGHVRVPSSTVADRKVHAFALCALLLPAAGVLLLFTPLRPQGEMPTLIWLGMLTFLSIVFATMAIRDIRREPQRYFGAALALLGAMAIPLLVLNTLVIFNVAEINPWSEALGKQKVARDFARMNQQLLQAHRERHGPDVPFEPPNPTVVMSETEKWIAEKAPLLPLLTDVAIIGLSPACSIFLIFWLYRRCCRRDRLLATDLP